MQTAYTIEIDCIRRSSRYLGIEMFNRGGKSLGRVSPPSRLHRPIISASTGDIIATFVCDPERDGQPANGYLTMLPIDVVADQTFRFIGLGINPDAAAALAAVDARRAPNAFNDLLNVLVAAERQPYVRAIKTPEASAD